MINQTKICGLIGLAMRAGKISFGTDACLEQIEKKKIKFLFLAMDASDRTKKVFREKCKEAQISIYEGFTIENLSQAIGKQNKAVIGIKDINFAKEIQKIISGGEVIG